MVSVYIHIRLSKAMGEKFTQRLLELGFSPMLNESGRKKTYFMLKDTERLLIEEESSGDILLTQASVISTDSELATILDATARKFAGDLIIADSNKQIYLKQGIEVATPEEVLPNQSQKNTQSAKAAAASPAAASPVLNVATGVPIQVDKNQYTLMAINAMARLSHGLSLDVLTLEDAISQLHRLTGALSVYCYGNESLLDQSMLDTIVAETKKEVQDAAREAASVRQKLKSELASNASTLANQTTAHGMAQLTPSTGSVDKDEDDPSSAISHTSFFQNVLNVLDSQSENDE